MVLVQFVRFCLGLGESFARYHPMMGMVISFFCQLVKCVVLVGMVLFLPTGVLCWSSRIILSEVCCYGLNCLCVSFVCSSMMCMVSGLVTRCLCLRFFSAIEGVFFCLLPCGL
jgi:hypothetical protein